MTHPQQPPGQQPGPYGGPPGGPYGGGYGPPPPKRNTGLILAVVAAVVVLVGAFGVTGFVAPGFLLGDDETSAGDGDDLSSGSAGNPDGPTDASAPVTDVWTPATESAPPQDDSAYGEGPQFVRAFLATVEGGDAEAAQGLLCPDSPSRHDVDTAIRGHASLRLNVPDMENTGDYVGVDLKGTVNGRRSSAARISATLEDNGWCVYTFYAL